MYTVRHKLMGLRIMKSREVEKVAAIWKLHLNGINNSARWGYSDGIT